MGDPAYKTGPPASRTVAEPAIVHDRRIRDAIGLSRMRQLPVLDLPVLGEAWVLNPPGHPRFAFDIAPVGGPAVGGWWRYAAGQLRSSQLPGWGQPVTSPLGGEVVAVHDGELDQGRLAPWRDVPATLLFRPLLRGRDVPAMAGNHVIIGVDGLFVLLAHLMHGSVAVAPGDTVSVQQPVGRIGASGNTLVPHLHLQALTSADPLTAEPHPFAVRRCWVFERRAGWVQRDLQPLPHRRCRVSADAPRDGLRLR